MVYIVIACHFKDSAELCETTKARVRRVLRLAHNTDDSIWVTGDVPYELGGLTLGGLMRNLLISHDFPSESIHLLPGGVGTFSEARAACEFPNMEEEITVISSPWYFFQGRPIWKRRAREQKIKVSFVSVSGTGGWRTWLTYAVLGIIVRAGILVGFERVLEHYFFRFQSRRRVGFTFDGCK